MEIEMQRLMLFVLMILSAAAPALAYVNGGDFHHSLHEFRDELNDQGWATCTSEDKGIPKPPPDADATSQLIARTVQKLPEKQREVVTLETKRELAKIAADAFKFGKDKNEQKIVEGQIGNVKYRLGTCPFRSYWETNYKVGGSIREPPPQIHALRKGLGTFVAIRIEGEGEAKE